MQTNDSKRIVSILIPIMGIQNKMYVGQADISISVIKSIIIIPLQLMRISISNEF